mgnify:CR=1 FL=1
MEIEFLYQIAILLMSVVIHEVAHGVTSNHLGDPTARYAGRLTLNPIKHLDPMGSFVVPTISYLLGGFIFGWAKPVPYNPHNLPAGRGSEVMVAAAGPISNFLIALFFGLLIRFSAGASFATDAFIHITALIVFLNVLLGVFNLMPIPPLDGSKLLYTLFPEKAYRMREVFDRFGIFAVLIFIFVLWQFISPVIGWIFTLITGLPLGPTF